jgi:hypothetical protein
MWLSRIDSFPFQRYPAYSKDRRVLSCLLLISCAELRALNNKQRKTGKAAPKRLTPHQKQIVERLIEAHGDDVEVGQGDGGVGKSI